MRDNTDNELAKRIRKIRIENNLTQLDVAKALNATPGYICNVESGRTAMSLRMLVYFAKLTNTTIDSLVGTIDSSYAATAIDNDIMGLISELSAEQKQKLIQTLKIWIE